MPETEPLDILPALAENPLVIHFAIQNGHGWIERIRGSHTFHRRTYAFVTAMPGLQHVQVEYRSVFNLFVPVPRRVNGKHVSKPVGRANITAHVGPARFLLPGVLFGSLRQVPGHGPLAGGTPYNGIRAVPRDEVPPETLDSLDPDFVEIIPPHSDDTGDEPVFHEMSDFEIRMVII